VLCKALPNKVLSGLPLLGAAQRDVHPGKPRDFELEFELLGNSWQFMANQAKRAGRLGLGAFSNFF
jgi:hypothetical protein